MRAVVYNGPKDVSVDEVADATIEARAEFYGPDGRLIWEQRGGADA